MISVPEILWKKQAPLSFPCPVYIIFFLILECSYSFVSLVNIHSAFSGQSRFLQGFSWSWLPVLPITWHREYVFFFCLKYPSAKIMHGKSVSSWRPSWTLIWLEVSLISAGQWFSHCDLQTSNKGSWETDRNANSQATWQNYWIRAGSLF